MHSDHNIWKRGIGTRRCDEKLKNFDIWAIWFFETITIWIDICEEFFDQGENREVNEAELTFITLFDSISQYQDVNFEMSRNMKNITISYWTVTSPWNGNEF
jgi:hypothetical protein